MFDNKTIDFSGLTLLVEIIDAGNLSNAARKMKVSRANISYHLQKLEKSVGVQLVRRTTRRLEPTEIGLKLYRHGRAIRDELSGAMETIEMLGRGLHGSVRVSVPTGFGHSIMTSWFLEFKHLYPEINLELIFENRVDDLLRDEVDIAIRVMSEPPIALVAKELAQVQYVACASTEYAASNGLPKDLGGLKNAPLITSSVVGRELRLSAYKDGERNEVTLHPTISSENFQFLHEAILSGLGVGIVPTYVVQEDLRQGRMVVALDEWRLSIFGRKMFLLRMPGRYQTQAVRAFIEFIVEKASKWII